MKILILTVLTTYTLGNIPVAHSTIPGGTIQIPDISYLEYKSTTSGRVPTIAIGDGVISDLWNNITEYPNPSYGTGGSIKAAYG